MEYSKTNVNDLAFEFFLPESVTLDNLDFQYKTKGWDGVNYNQGLPECYFGTNFHLIKIPIPKHHLGQLAEQYKNKQWSCISVKGRGLEIFAKTLSGSGTEEKGFSLEDLITTLVNFKGQWAVVFEPDHDFELEIKTGTVDDIMDNVKSSLTIKKHGFIVYGES